MAGKLESWIEASDVLPMFPTLVWKFQIKSGIRTDLNASIVEALHRLGAPELQPGEAWQSNRSLETEEQFHPLMACVEQAAKSVLRFLKIGYDAFTVTGCWVSVNAPGTSHRAHSHPNNFLSGVYYVQTPAGADTINFHDPRKQTGIIRPPVQELTAENTDQVVVNVSEGTLLLFPSFLEHSVDPNPGDTVRISVSFNIMFTSFAENLAKPLW